MHPCFQNPIRANASPRFNSCKSLSYHPSSSHDMISEIWKSTSFRIPPPKNLCFLCFFREFHLFLLKICLKNTQPRKTPHTKKSSSSTCAADSRVRTVDSDQVSPSMLLYTPKVTAVYPRMLPWSLGLYVFFTSPKKHL